VDFKKEIENVQKEISEVHEILGALLEDKITQRTLVEAASACNKSIASGGKILIAGNGGSAADAQHIAAEFVNYFKFPRPGLPAVALTTDSSVMTSISNDTSFDLVFARQIEALGNPGDAFIGYSTSGRSVNVIRAFEAARTKGVVTIGLTGSGADQMAPLCDFLLSVPSSNTPHIQEAHLVMGHILSGLVESWQFPDLAK
jgi:D-sedoheptulose 7-phosphate isomerase